MTESADALTLAEARELAAASVAHQAAALGVPILLIKGATLAEQGLRAPRESADVDVWASPAQVGNLVAALVDRGWHVIVEDTTAHVMAPASVTLVHKAWPLELDLHHTFPGFLVDPQKAFDLLWERRQSLVQANQTVPMPDLLGSVLIAALHYERAPALHRNDLADLLDRSRGLLDAEGLQDLAELAERTGCADTARSFLDRLGVPPLGVGRSDPETLEAWGLLTSGGWVTGVAWLESLRRARWRDRPRLLWHALMFTEEELRFRFPSAPPGPRGIWLARYWRLRHAIRALPQALGVLRRQGSRRK